MSLRTHLTVVYQAKVAYSTRAAFKVPKLVGTDSDNVEEWTTVTYAQFALDIERFARYWATVLSKDGVPPRSTVAMWYVPLTIHRRHPLTSPSQARWHDLH